MRIGGDRLRIYEDQVCPCSYNYCLLVEVNETNTDWGSMQDSTGLTIDYGDNPPDLNQLTVKTAEDETEKPIVKNSLLPFRIVTPIFTAVIPDVQYGRSIKDFLESPVAPGSYPAMVEGYFVMIKFDRPHPKEGRLLGSFLGECTSRSQGAYFRNCCIR